jgi:hypothetical protein
MIAGLVDEGVAEVQREVVTSPSRTTIDVVRIRISDAGRREWIYSLYGTIGSSAYDTCRRALPPVTKGTGHVSGPQRFNIHAEPTGGGSAR